ncbi:putative adenine nucleotide translocase [Suillus placidus]|uniref:ADP/ATP translocase n=1 Tax=Suillus placidus TaxID=48579 RepID=A0A9P6ZZM2_9AGAM|nr:putative adenine nucleotide translocase [Suillus placidus]
MIILRARASGGFGTAKPNPMTDDSTMILNMSLQGAALAAYPLDTIRRRMMTTSGEKVQYRSFIEAGRHIMAKEGVKSLFAEAGANILRGVTGAGVLSLYDKFQELAWGKAYQAGSG